MIETTYYLDGKAYTFDTQEELDAWLNQNPTATTTNTNTRKTSWFLGEEGFIPDEFQGIKRPDVTIEAKKAANTDTYTSPIDIEHVSAGDLESAIGDNWRNKEGNAQNILNKTYKIDQNLDVKFIQSKAGYNELKMVVGGIEIDEPIELTQNMDWSDLQANIKLKIDDQFGNKKQSKKNEDELLAKILSLDLPENILDFDNNGLNKAEFANILDNAFNNGVSDVPDIEWINASETLSHFFVPEDELLKSGPGQSRGRSFAPEDIEKYGNRLSFEAEQSIPMFIKEGVGLALSFGQYDASVANMNGGIKLEDGTYIPYTYLWDKRKKLQENKNLIDNDNLLKKKQKEYGGRQGFVDHITNNSWIYLDDEREVEIRNLNVELEKAEDDSDKLAIKNKINSLWKDLYPDLSDEDIEKLTLFDENGNFVSIKKPQGEQDPTIEGEAENLARNNDEDYLEDELVKAFVNYVNIQKRVYKNREKIGEQASYVTKNIGQAFDFSNDALQKDITAAMYISEYEDLFIGDNGLSNLPVLRNFKDGSGIPSFSSLMRSDYINSTVSELPGNSDLATENNEALRKFKVLARSIDLNLSINRTPEENAFKEFTNNVTEAFVGEKLLTEIDSDEARDAWTGILEHDGYGELQADGTTKIPEHVIESSFFKNGNLGKNNNYRAVVEKGGEVLAGLGPLLTELFVFKKAGGLKSLNTLFGRNSKVVQRLTANIENPAAKFIAQGMIPTGLVTTAEWSIAEGAGQLATGGAWKSHTIDFEKGETNFTMPMTMGMAGPVFGEFSKGAMRWFGNTRVGKQILPRIQNKDLWINKTDGGAAVKSLGAVPKSIGQGGVATVMLVASETSQALVDEAVKQEDFALVERLKEIYNQEHVISTWFAMTILSGKDIAPKAREAFRQTVASFKADKAVIAKANKELKVDENSSYGDINRATRKRLEEIYESDLSIKEINIKVKEIKQLNRKLRLNKLIESSRNTAIKADRYYEDFVLPRWEVMRNLSTKDVTKWTAEDYRQINELSHAELYQVLGRSGINPGTKQFKQYEQIFDAIKQTNRVVDHYDIDAGLLEFRGEYIKNTLSLEINNSRIAELKQKIKDNKDVSISKIELKRLEKANENFFESNETLFDRAGLEFNKRLKAEVAAARVLAGNLGASIKTYGKEGDLSIKDWKEKAKKEGFDSKSEGLYVERGKKGEIHINLEAIKDTRNLGTPIHEVVHHVLRNAIMKTIGTGKTARKVVSADGIAIIDGLMQKFSEKARKVIQKRIDDNYRYDIEGKEKNKEDYYDEYITSIGDAIKNKQIKYDTKTFRKIGNIVYPMFKPLMPKLYQGVLRGTSSTKATQDLYNMLGDIYLSSSSTRVKESLKELGQTKGPEGKKVAETVYSALSKSTSKYKGPVNKIGEKIDGKEFTTENALVELYGKDGKGLLPQLIGVKLKPFEKLPDFRYEDMVSETIVESMAHVRNFNFDLKREGTDFGLYGWIDSQLTNKIKRVLGTGKATKQKFEIEIGGEKLKDIESTEMTAEEMLDAKMAAEKIAKEAPNLRKSLVNQKGDVGIKNSDAIVATIKNAVVKTLGSKLPKASTKEFKVTLQNQYKDFLKKPIADMMGTRKNYDNFLNNNYPVLQRFIPISKLVQLERLVKPENRVFTTEETRLTKIKEVREAIDKGLIDPSISETAGNTLYKKKNYSQSEWFDFFRGKNVAGSTKGTRKDALAEIIGSELAFDMTIEVAKSPEMMKFREGVNNKTNEQVQIEVAEMAKRIDRDPNMKFSLSAKEKKHKKVQSAAEFVVNHQALLKIVVAEGYNKVFDSNGVLRVEFDKLNFDQISVALIKEQFNAGKINVGLNIAEIGLTTRALQNAGAKFDVKTSDVVEQIPIEMGRLYGKKFGLQMKTLQIEEGGVADFNSLTNGIEWNVETKAFKFQLARHSSGMEINFATGKGNKILESLPLEVRNEPWALEMLAAYKATNAGRKKYNDFVVPKMKKLKIEGVNEIFNNTLIPVELFTKGQLEGLQAQTTINIPFKNGIEYISYKYANKKLKDGTPAANYDINISSVYNARSKKGKELGLYSINGENNRFNLPKLEVNQGGIMLVGRFSAGSVTPAKAPKGYEKFHKPGQKYYKPQWTFIPKLDPFLIKNKSEFALDNKSKFIKFLKSESYQRDMKLNSKEVLTQMNKQVQNVVGKKYSKSSKKEVIKDIETIDKAIELGRVTKKKSRGMSTFDFDETVGVSNNFVIAKKAGKTKKIPSDKWPFVGEKLVNQGWKMDFTDFNRVTDGKPGPLMQKLKNQIKKFGPENVFILTARAPESQKAIYEYLKTEGVNIPFKNITGLGNSTGAAKAMWMLKKFSEGYNDMYFVDDALPNVKAVKEVLSQLDIKSNVQMVRASMSKNRNKEVNNIMEHSLGIAPNKTFSKAEAKIRGKDIKRRRIFMRDSAADLELLIEPLYGKGKKGNENKKWFRDTFVMPFETGIRDYNIARQGSKNDYMALRKQNKDVVKIISKEVEGTSFTNDMAMRVYLWNKAGYKIPDLAKATETKLVEHIKNNPRLQQYAETFATITKQKKGLKQPGENWWAETMAGEVTNIDRGVSRAEYLKEFIEIKNEIFSEINLNKMESKLGTRWRENIEDMFDRMETGRTRSLKLDRGSSAMMNYLNGGIGTIMNFNTRSAALQTISTLNFLNMRENNPISAARAMANIPQFAKDFKFIMNSPMLKQRRDGLTINVTEAEIASAAASSPNMIQGIISKVLKLGYTPTKLADSFAISFGGATFYRNRIRMYEKQGMETKQAEEQAFLDFQVLAERTQQSSRADLLSRQQTTLIGRFILPFANTPMQMNRAGMKDILDIAKGRTTGLRNTSEAVGRISYYMGAQVSLFAGLQSALFAMLYNDDDVTEEKIANTKAYTLQSTIDSMLKGFGVQGAFISGFKNAILEFLKQNAKSSFKADYSEVAEDLLNISPPIGSKFGLLDSAGDDVKYAGDVPFKFELGNPLLRASLKTIQATTNAPVYSPYQNADNIKHAMSDQYETWQRVMMGGGWTPFNVGIEQEKKKKKSTKFTKYTF